MRFRTSADGRLSVIPEEAVVEWQLVHNHHQPSLAPSSFPIYPQCLPLAIAVHQEKDGRTALHHLVWSALARRKDPHRDSRPPRPGEDTHLARPRAVHALDGREDAGRVAGRLSAEGAGVCAELTVGLLYAR